MPKPQASCTMTVSPGMVVQTQLTSAVADKAQHGVMELLLVNHPLDCPICDKGGECPLQNQAMSNGRGESRFVDAKRTFAKPIKISTQVLLDRERCILCQRCTRFSKEIAGDTFIDLQKRGASAADRHVRHPTSSGSPAALTEGAAELDEAGAPFASYFSGNTIQICPVGALTGAAYRFRARPFDLVSSATVCEHCSSGCAVRADHRRGVVLRRLAGEDPAVNEEWNCDKGRWAFTYATLPDRLQRAHGPRRGDRRAGRDLLAGRASTSPPAAWPPPVTAPVSARSSVAGSPSRTPTPTPSSPAWCSAPTTSTCGPDRTPSRRRPSSPRRSPAPASASPTRTSRTRRRGPRRA